MYFLYLSSFFVLFYSVYKLCFRSSSKEIKKFDHIDEHEFRIESIYFYKNDKYLCKKDFNKIYDSQKRIEINTNFLYDYYIVNYYYGSNFYRFISKDNYLIFPFYTNEQIKNYVYINKIKKVKVKVNTNENENDEEIVNTKITQIINTFMGPNYNFYKDIDQKLMIEYIISYLKTENLVQNKENSTYKFIFYDNFNNEYTNNLDYLIWNPNLRL